MTDRLIEQNPDSLTEQDRLIRAMILKEIYDDIELHTGLSICSSLEQLVILYRFYPYPRLNVFIAENFGPQ